MLIRVLKGGVGKAVSVDASVAGVVQVKLIVSSNSSY